MDNIRSSFSRVKKDFKHRLRGKNREPDGTETNVAGERVGSSDSRPEPRLAADDRDEESSRISTDGRQVRLRDRFPQPEPVTAGRSHNDKRREADAGGQTPAEKRLARGIRAWTRTPSLRWIADPARGSDKFIPLRPVRHPIVCENLHFCCYI